MSKKLSKERCFWPGLPTRVWFQSADNRVKLIHCGLSSDLHTPSVVHAQDKKESLNKYIIFKLLKKKFLNLQVADPGNNPETCVTWDWGYSSVAKYSPAMRKVRVLFLALQKQVSRWSVKYDPFYP